MAVLWHGSCGKQKAFGSQVRLKQQLPQKCRQIFTTLRGFWLNIAIDRW
jgi:hypothetical protein